MGEAVVEAAISKNSIEQHSILPHKLSSLLFVVERHPMVPKDTI